MKREDLFTAIGDADEELLENSERTDKRHSHNAWRQWGILAACLCVVALVAIWLAPDNRTALGPGGLPMLEAQPQWGGMGYEGLMFYDISESDSANPWTPDAQLESLPVFRNLAYTDLIDDFSIYLSEEKMLALAEKAAAALGVTITAVEEQTPDYVLDPKDCADYVEVYGERAYRLVATTRLGNIEVEGTGNVRIEIACQVPEEYSFTYSDTSDSEAVHTIDYLLNKFAAVVELEAPVISTWKHYSFSGEPHREYCAFSGSGNLVQRIVNYNFNTVSFNPDEEENMILISINNFLPSVKKMGEYPILSLEEARTLLLEGAYYTTVPQEHLPKGISEEIIAKEELVYRCDRNLMETQVFIPYYCFYLELDMEGIDEAEGLKNYGTYYVPAVSGEYLSDYPVWDGGFR